MQVLSLHALSLKRKDQVSRFHYIWILIFLWASNVMGIHVTNILRRKCREEKETARLVFLTVQTWTYNIYIIWLGAQLVYIFPCYKEYYSLNLDSENLLLPTLCFRSKQKEYTNQPYCEFPPSETANYGVVWLTRRTQPGWYTSRPRKDLGVKIWLHSENHNWGTEQSSRLS